MWDAAWGRFVDGRALWRAKGWRIASGRSGLRTGCARLAADGGPLAGADGRLRDGRDRFAA